jgi:hypothetical protein
MSCIFPCLVIQAAFSTSCGQHNSTKKVETKNAVKERIDALRGESLGTISSGKAYAHPTENTEFIISHKEAAIPLLVDALNDEKEPIKIGYAAYILRRLQSDEGIGTATNVYEKLSAKGPNMSLEERFAMGELMGYSEQVGSKAGSPH